MRRRFLHSLRPFFAPMLAALLAVFLVLPALSAPRAQRSVDSVDWHRHDDSNQTRVDHSLFARFLASHRGIGDDGVARLAYGLVPASDARQLQTYIDTLSRLPVSEYNRAEQVAYWLNLYNALTINVILEHYPVDSIREIDISRGLFADGPWGAALIEVSGTPLSLDDIEHRILRRIFPDARIHYALNCASVGCPDLAAKPYDGENLDAMLEEAAKAFINHPRGVRVEKGRVIASKIYKWYNEDFGKSEADILQHIRVYARPELRLALEQVPDKIARYRYDWGLNDLKPLQR